MSNFIGVGFLNSRSAFFENKFTKLKHFSNCRQEISACSMDVSCDGCHISPKCDEVVNAKQRKLSDSMVTDQPIVPIVSVVPQSTRTHINGTNAISTTATTAPTNPQTTGNIPQDLTIMSDNDLISYINPSCFDQGNWLKRIKCIIKYKTDLYLMVFPFISVQL